MKEIINVPQTYTESTYSPNPELGEGCKKNTKEHIELRPGTFIF
ncbi:hypothetical protein [Chryseobacterium angstadtii]|nr:hypothetical protein [Chryseobacterium angstadtii]